MGSAISSQPRGRRAKPLLGLRRHPGRLALAVFRLPLLLIAGEGAGCSATRSCSWSTPDGRPASPTSLPPWCSGMTRKLTRRSSARRGARTPTGSGTSGSVRRCGSSLGGSRSHRSSASFRRMRAWRWRPSSGTGIPDGYGSCRGSWAGEICVRTLPSGALSAPGRSCHCVRRFLLDSVSCPGSLVCRRHAWRLRTVTSLQADERGVSRGIVARRADKWRCHVAMIGPPSSPRRLTVSVGAAATATAAW